MARHGIDQKLSTVQPKRRPGTAAARANLPKIVHELGGFRRAARSLAERAVEVGPRRQGGACLVPEIDAHAAIERERVLARRVAELEELLEDLSAAPIVEARSPTPAGEWVTLDELAASLGLEDVLREARSERRS